MLKVTEKKKEYMATVLSMVVKPEKEPIFSELATIVEIVDEAAGEYVEVRQESDRGKSHADTGTIAITSDDWPMIRDTIEKMLAQCRNDEGENEE